METEINKWNFRFVELAERISSWSKDRSTKVGAIIVNPNDNNPISMGYNGFPAGIDDNVENRHLRPDKYYWTIHGELNAIINAAKNGQKTKNCDIYVNFFPCSNCAGAIVNAGIKRVFCNNKPDFNNSNWGMSWKIAETIFKEANIEIIYINKCIGNED